MIDQVKSRPVAASLTALAVILLVVDLLLLVGWLDLPARRSSRPLAGDSSAHTIAAAPDGRHVYVLGKTGVRVIDTRANTVVAEIGVQGDPIGLMSGRDATTMWVLTSDGLSSINNDTLQVTAQTVADAGGYITAATITADGGQVYVANGDLPTVTMVDTRRNRPTTRIRVDDRTATATGLMALSPDDRHLYVIHSLRTGTSGPDVRMAVIDVGSGKVTADVRLQYRCNALVVGHDSGHVYAISSDGYLSVFDTATNLMARRRIPTSIAFTDDMLTSRSGRYLLIAGRANNDDLTTMSSLVTVFDTVTEQIIDTLNIGDPGKSTLTIALSPDGRTLYLGTSGSDRVNSVDVSNYE